MSWRYESPADPVAWGLIVARALAAPLLSVYLSLARPLPVTARDMLALAERIAGEGVLRRVTHIAAAVISPDDRTRLDAMLDVAQRRASASVSEMAASVAEKPDTRPPTGPGTPSASKRRGAHGARWQAAYVGLAGAA
jgi:hypothetical protein